MEGLETPEQVLDTQMNQITVLHAPNDCYRHSPVVFNG